MKSAMASLARNPERNGEMYLNGARQCFHCNAPLPPGNSLYLQTDSQCQPVCCAGCLAAAESIMAAGLDNYYEFRTSVRGPVHGLTEEELTALAAYDLPEVQKQWLIKPDAAEREVALLLNNIVCPACTWLIEQRLRSLPGVIATDVNYTTQRLRVRWQPERLRLSDILTVLAQLGYPGQPYQPAQRELLARTERRRLLRQLGVAAALGMQVMMLSLAVYAVDPTDIDPLHLTLINMLNFVLTVPVVCYSGQAFFASAWRDLANGRLGMDVPVALGILLAFVASVVGTCQTSAHTYYDSVTMFILLLLTGRYVELLVRQRAATEAEHFENAMPEFATRVVSGPEGEHDERVLASQLVRNDTVRIKPGERIPVDGRVIAGHSGVDEAVLSGESRPITKELGSNVIGGSINIDNVLVMRVEKRSDEGVFAAVKSLVHTAQAQRPPLTATADRLAPWVIAGVLLVALLVAGRGLSLHDPAWLEKVLAVLVVACPCAVSLAVPVTVTAASNRLLRAGILMRSASALEALASVTHVAFDKTGTLTQGYARLVATVNASGVTTERCLQIVATLEQSLDHPIARSLRNATALAARACEVRHTPGGGVSGVIDGERYYCGSPAFVSAQLGNTARQQLEAALLREDDSVSTRCTRVVVASERQLLGEVFLEAALRPEARATVETLQARGLVVSMLSGDRVQAARTAAGLAGITNVHADLLPEDKLHHLQDLQQRGEKVAMVGDGINDAPVLAAADVSFALGGGTDLARAQADYIIVGDDLSKVTEAHALALQAMALLRQNLGWAVAYNMTALPAAVAGWLDPWLAALGMALSSLLVVGNALRLK